MLWLSVLLVLPYFLLLLLIYRGMRKIKPFRPEKQASQFVSVIIACRNEQDNLPLVLSHIETQVYPPALFEVIIVDDGSCDRTYETALSFQSRIRNLKILKNRGSGKKAAILQGVYAAQGSLIVTTDADCRMGPSWLATIASFYSETGSNLVICPVKMKGTNSLAAKLAELEFLALQGISKGTAAMGSATMCNGANLAFSKELYTANEGELHTEIPTGDDIFLLHAAKRSKKNLISWLDSVSAIVETAAPGSITSLFSQRKRWLSKAYAYNDSLTINLGIVTFVTILIQALLTVSLLFHPSVIYMYLAVLFLKSVPDFLIMHHTAKSYNNRIEMHWFVPLQVIYPFYVLIIAAGAFAGTRKEG